MVLDARHEGRQIEDIWGSKADVLQDGSGTVSGIISADREPLIACVIHQADADTVMEKVTFADSVLVEVWLRNCRSVPKRPIPAPALADFEEASFFLCVFCFSFETGFCFVVPAGLILNCIDQACLTSISCAYLSSAGLLVCSAMPLEVSSSCQLCDYGQLQRM